MSSISSPVFAGVSSYAQDLQQVITRSVNIAALPLKQLNNQLQDLNLQSSALEGLNTAFSKLQSALHDLDLSLGPKSYTGKSSNPDAIGVSVGLGAVESAYTIDVSNLGSYTTAMSDAALTVSDPSSSSISTAAAYTLTVDGQETSITPAGNSLIELVQAINESSAGVRASLVNLGDSGAPQYRLILAGTILGSTAIQLGAIQSDNTTLNLLMDPTPGAQATYDVNGLGLEIKSDSRTVTLAPGITVDLLRETSGAPATGQISRDPSGAATALAAFTDAYNGTVAALDRQAGEKAGPLMGQSIVRELYGSLRSMSQYTFESGPVRSLADLGLSLDRNGTLTFDESKFNELSADAVQNFLGSASSGGFLKLATGTLNGIEDSSTGSLTQAMKSTDKQVAAQNDLIAAGQQRVTDLQTRLQQQMAAADSLIASLESRKTYLTNLFSAMLNPNGSK
jgi:flagellar hook-associated protein 2